MKDWPSCNARLKGWASRVPKAETGPHGGDGYCGRPAGWGFVKEGINDADRKTMRCRQHGAAALIHGPAHPSYVHGSRSKYAVQFAPAAVKRMIEEMVQESPEALSRAPEINLVAARVYYCLEQVQTHQPDPGSILKLVNTAIEMLDAGVTPILRNTLVMLGNVAREGITAEAWWEKMLEAIALQSRVQKDELDFRSEVGRYVRLEKLQVVADRLVDAVHIACEKHISDPEVQRMVRDEVASHLEGDIETAA